MKLLRSFLAALALATLCASAAYAAKCGGLNQRPCTIFERIPSCNKGLVENFRINKCVRPAPPPKPQRPAHCGREGQKPCTVFEYIPSCDTGLAEDFVKNVCIRPNVCGKENQRPCNIVERVPSCDAGLIEDFGANKCVKTANLSCGKRDQRPCLLVERVPSCDDGLAEDFVKGKCILPNACGAKGERPCNLVERVPSCNAGLAEDFVLNECVVATTLDKALCMTGLGLAQQQNDAYGARSKADQPQISAFIDANPGARSALETAVSDLLTRKAPQIDNLIAIGIVMSTPEYADLRRAIGDKEKVCLEGKIDVASLAAEVRKNPRLALRGVASASPQVADDPFAALLGEGAVSLGAEWEASGLIGLASSFGPVMTYGQGGQTDWGVQLSSQVQVITMGGASAGAQLGWWPGSKLAGENTLFTIVGKPRDGFLSGPYVTAHLGASGGFLGNVGVALDFVFEVPSHLSDLGQRQWYLDNFSGVTVTVAGGVDATQLPGIKPNAALALGNTMTVSALD